MGNLPQKHQAIQNSCIPSMLLNWMCKMISQMIHTPKGS